MRLAHRTRAGMSCAVSADMIDGVGHGCVMPRDLREGIIDSGHNVRKLRRACRKQHVCLNMLAVICESYI